MKKLMFLVILALVFMGLSAEGADWTWAKSAGGTFNDEGKAIAVDTSGNSYISGFFKGTATFGPTILTSSGNEDTFVAKLDADGNWLWAKSAGGTSGNAIAVDAAGNCYVSGYLYGAATFGSTNLTCSGGWDIFVAKLDTNGNWLWARRAGGVSYDCGYAIAVDAVGNSYISGYFYGTAIFGTTSLISSGAYNIFVAKLDTDGNWLWAKRAGGTSSDMSYAIAVDTAGNSYISGFIDGPATFGTTILSNSGSGDIFVAKIDPSGNWLWAKQAGGMNDDEGKAIAVDAAGNSFISGDFQDSATFGTTILTSSGNQDIFVAKLDTNGNWLWAKQAGGEIGDTGNAIAVDALGNCSLIGYFNGTATFGTTILTSDGGSDVLVAKMDASGNWLWAKQVGGALMERGHAIAVDAAGNNYISGCFWGTETFGSTSMTSDGYMDIFVAKLELIYSPQTPVNVDVSMEGYNALLTWDAVTENTENQPMIPEYYLVYFNDSTDPDGVFSLLEMSSTNQFTHTNVALEADHMFYCVRALKLDPPGRGECIDVLELKSRLQQVLKVGMTESEVSKALDHLWDECSK